MTSLSPTSWQGIQAEVLRRIHAREWPPGHVIPNEVDLAAEFDCARATVNRALRTLAEAGVLERRRKAGTRVVLHPVSRATLDISILRQEIEATGQSYGYTLLGQALKTPPKALQTTLGNSALHIRALHMANDTPYVIEDRWINLTAAPKARDQAFDRISANEWLIQSVPYTHGDITFSATNASARTAKALQTDKGAAIFVINRTTFDHDQVVTHVCLSYAPGYTIKTIIGG